MVHVRFKTPPKDIQIPINLKTTLQTQSSMVSLSMDFYFFQFVSKWLVQQVREQMFSHSCAGMPIVCNTAAQNPSLLADLSTVLACPRHNISALQLISVHSRIIRDVPLFLCCIRRASWPVQQSQSSSSQPKNASPYHPLFSLHTHPHSK